MSQDFPRKRVVVLSARVHPGETPTQDRISPVLFTLFHTLSLFGSRDGLQLYIFPMEAFYERKIFSWMEHNRWPYFNFICVVLDMCFFEQK